MSDAPYTSEYQSALLHLGVLADGDIGQARAFCDNLPEEAGGEMLDNMVYLLGLSSDETIITCYYFSAMITKGTVPSLEDYLSLCERLEHPLISLPITMKWQDNKPILSPVCRDYLLMREPELPQGINLILPEEDTVYHNEDIVEDIVKFTQNYSDNKAVPAMIIIEGESGTGKKFLLRQAAKRLDATFLHLEGKFDAELNEIILASLLFNAFLVITDHKQIKSEQIKLLQKKLGLVFITSQEPVLPIGDIVLQRKLKAFTEDERYRVLSDFFPECGDDLIKNLSYLPLNMKKLMAAKSMVKAEITLSEHNIAQVVESALKKQDTPEFAGGAQLMQTGKTLKDVVLPEQQERTLKNICNFARNKNMIYENWGFAEKIAYGKGISVLFYGASGTGKTLAATAMANELGKPLYKVDLSQITSKYVGETQKNIGKIFDTAQRSDCILFFDEADALFTKRFDAGDAQDKHANGEIAYLLQKTEQFEGITILATNLLQNFDEAFRRRIGFMIRFPMPDAALRLRMWQNIIPESAPCDYIDFDLLAREFELSGAAIKNSALSAAFLAYASGENIGMAHIIAAIKNEYDKLGKTLPMQILQMYAPQGGISI